MSDSGFISAADRLFCWRRASPLAPVGTGHAATDRFAEFPTADSFSHVTSASVYDLYPMSFDNRFNGVPAASVLGITTASLPRHAIPARSSAPADIVAAARRSKASLRCTIRPMRPTWTPATKNLPPANATIANGWTAAIHRRPAGEIRRRPLRQKLSANFALVEASDKQLIVKINDVGPLKPAAHRSQQTRDALFRPDAALGLIGNVKVTPLAGQQWALGSDDEDQPVAVASRYRP